MRTKKIIHLDNIHHNVHLIRSIIPSHTLIAASMKSNAYGHGSIEVATHIQSEVDYWGVATIDEAITLVDNKLSLYPNTPTILFYSMLPRRELEEAIVYMNSIDTHATNRFEFMVGDMEYMSEIALLCSQCNISLGIHLKIETGMGRIGIFPHDILKVLEIMQESPCLILKGICSHYSDSSNDEMRLYQTKLFSDSLLVLNEQTFPQCLVHIANSGAIIWDNEHTSFDMVRPGIMLYGGNPNPYKRIPSDIALRHGMSLLGSVAVIKHIPKGHGVSYNATYQPTRDTDIAIINMGYGDGLLRSLSNKGVVSIHGIQYPIVGKVCMDMCMVDLQTPIDVPRSSIPLVKRNDEVEFWGENIPVDEQACRVDTIPYELMCSINSRVSLEFSTNSE